MQKRTTTYCHECGNHTNQIILFSKKITSIYEEDSKKSSRIKNYEEYLVVKCQGCNTISFVIRLSGDHFIDEEHGKGFIDINFPDQENDKNISLLTFEELQKLPRQISKLYDEVETVFLEDAKILAGIGLRMVIEAICLEQNIQGKNLQRKIEELHIKGLISKNEIAILDKLREIGNSSAHEIKSFSIHKLKYALDIINHILKSVYVLPAINKKLRL